MAESISKRIQRSIAKSERAGIRALDVSITDNEAILLSDELFAVQMMPLKSQFDIYQMIKSGEFKFMDRTVTVVQQS